MGQETFQSAVRLASLAMAGVNTWAHDFSNEHGRTSSGDDLDGMPDNSFRISSTVTGLNEDSCSPWCWRTANVRRIDDCSAAEMLSQMRLTLSTKNWQNVETSCAHWASSLSRAVEQASLSDCRPVRRYRRCCLAWRASSDRWRLR